MTARRTLPLVFLTNNFDMEALEIATVYKSRWRIEVFFKWIKQNLQVKTLWGHPENAVKTHLWIAICTYLVVAYLKQRIKIPYSIYEMTQISGISTFAKTPINELFTNSCSNG